MKHWLFTFTQLDRQYCTARVAAPDKNVACAVMGNYLGRPLAGQANMHPEPGTILQYLGMVDVPDPIITAITNVDGAQLV